MDKKYNANPEYLINEYDLKYYDSMPSDERELMISKGNLTNKFLPNEPIKFIRRGRINLKWINILRHQK